MAIRNRIRSIAGALIPAIDTAISAALALKAAKAANLSDLASASAARTNLGLGTAAVTAATAYEPAKGADDNYVTDAEKAALHAVATVSGDGISITGQQISLNTSYGGSGMADSGKLAKYLPSGELQSAGMTLARSGFGIEVTPDVLTANRTALYPNKSGTVAYTSDITGTNSGTNTGDETGARIATLINAATPIATLADDDRIGGTDTSASGIIGYITGTVLWTWIVSKLAALTGTTSIGGSVNFDTNTLFVDATNNRVGIGTASPLTPLHILATGNISLISDAADGGDSQFQFRQWGISKCIFGASTVGIRIYDNQLANNLFYSTQNSGKVGILCTDATEVLDVDGSIKTRASFKAGSGTWDGATFAGAQAFSNGITARIAPRVTTITSHATPTINTDNCDCVTITALAEAITSMTTNLSGTPANFDQLLFRIKDDGTARAITWGASFIARGGILPTTTVASKVWHVLFIRNSVTSTWDCVSSALEV